MMFIASRFRVKFVWNVLMVITYTNNKENANKLILCAALTTVTMELVPIVMAATLYLKETALLYQLFRFLTVSQQIMESASNVLKDTL